MTPSHSDILGMATGSLMLGASACWLAAEVTRIVSQPRRPDAQLWQHDERRRSKLREGSAVYRWFEPLIDEAARATWLHRLANLPSVERSLSRGANRLPWTAAEYMAMRVVVLLLHALVIWTLLFLLLDLGSATLVAGVYAAFGFFTSARTLAALADARIAKLKQRLPFAIDLMALMMEAGGDFRQCLGTVVHENREHPVGEEFGKLLQTFHAGQPLREGLDDLSARMRDEDLSEIAFSIKNAEELGVPLGKTFLGLAEQMRLKQAQRAERTIGERKTMLALPGLIVMIGCLIIAVAPFLLAAFTS